jgi:hypothetical protein
VTGNMSFKGLQKCVPKQIFLHINIDALKFIVMQIYFAFFGKMAKFRDTCQAVSKINNIIMNLKKQLVN